MSWSFFIVVDQQIVLVSASVQGPQKVMPVDPGSMVNRQLDLLEAIKIIYLRSIAIKVLLEVLDFVPEFSVKCLKSAFTSKWNY
tara:strand:- start:567 stop:818 length:252 start_codon:yes stop_codon:yes gene_type:complete